MSAPRGEIDTAVVVLTNGTVLVPGGNFQPETGQSTAELYVPSVGKWFSAGRMSKSRGSGQMAVLLGSGQVLVFGGLKRHRNAPNLATATADLYTPAS